jgi:hypothetical protein
MYPLLICLFFWSRVVSEMSIGIKGGVELQRVGNCVGRPQVHVVLSQRDFVALASRDDGFQVMLVFVAKSCAWCHVKERLL